MVFRVKALWRWLILLIGVVLAPPFVFVPVFLAIHSDPHDRQTPGQKLATSAIFLAIAAALACAPWVAWTGRLWLSETGIKLQSGLRTKEIMREQIRTYSMQGGLQMGPLRILPPSLWLFGAENKALMAIPGYFEGQPDLRAWLEKVPTARSGASRV
jgi:hypothetical protein